MRTWTDRNNTRDKERAGWDSHQRNTKHRPAAKKKKKISKGIPPKTAGRELDHGGNDTQPWKHLDGEPPGLELLYSPGLEKCAMRKVP